MAIIIHATIYRRAAWLICALALLTMVVACENPEPPPSIEVAEIVATPPPNPTAEASAPPAAHTPTPEPTFTPTATPAPEPTPAPTASPEPVATPTHTPTPNPIGRSRELPAPAGSTIVTSDGLAFTVVSVNLDAADEVLNEDESNDPPDAGSRFVMARVRVQNVGGDVDIETYVNGEADFLLAVFSTDGFSRYRPSCGRIPNELKSALFLGGIDEGNVCFEIPESETDLMLMYESPCPSFASCVPNPRWLELANPDDVEAPRVVEASLAPVPGQLPGHFRANPAPPGTTVEANDGVALTVVSVNPDATGAVMNGIPLDEPPAEGNRFVMARVRVQNLGDDPNTEIGGPSLDLVGSSAVKFWLYKHSCGVIPNAPGVALFPGGFGEGEVCFEVPESETDLTLIYSPRIYHPETSQFVFEERRWLTLANPDVVEAPRIVDVSLAPSPDQTLGHFRTNPAPPGMSVETDEGFALTIVSVNPDAAAAITENPSNKPPSEGNRFLIVRVRMENVARRENYVWDHFGLVGSSAAIVSSFRSCGIVPDEIERPFPGGTIEGNICFQIPESETDLILIYSSVESERRWMRLP